MIHPTIDEIGRPVIHTPWPGVTQIGMLSSLNYEMTFIRTPDHGGVTQQAVNCDDLEWLNAPAWPRDPKEPNPWVC